MGKFIFSKVFYVFWETCLTKTMNLGYLNDDDFELKKMGDKSCTVRKCNILQAMKYHLVADNAAINTTA